MNTLTVFDIQREAQETRDLEKLKDLRKMVPDSIGTKDQKDAVGMFINESIRNPSREILIK